MSTRWAPAHGKSQLPFLGAATRALHGEIGPCPNCGAHLRAYFHVFQPETRKGSLWAWCGSCGMYVTLPRVQPKIDFPDPFADIPRGEFGALETSSDEPFIDRLERLWSDGTLRPPKP